jgi:hypothetical protein
MKKINTLQIFAITTFVAVSIFIGTASIANATVGGELLVSGVHYNTQTKSVIYSLQDNGGRGCPPSLLALNSVTGQSKTIFDCDSKLSSAYQTYEARNADYVKNFQPVSPVNIKKLGLGVTLTKLSEEKMGDENWIVRTMFRMTVTQNGLKMYEKDISGCSVEQPWVIGGYVAQDLKNKLILLVSGKGDCFEGGYVTESLHIVPAVIDGFQYINAYKGSWPLIPTIGNLVVYAQAETSGVKPSTTPTRGSGEGQGADRSPFESTRSLLTLAGFCLVTFVLGLFMGKLIQVPREQ